jgi:hypothetical protein
MISYRAGIILDEWVSLNSSHFEPQTFRVRDANGVLYNHVITARSFSTVSVNECQKAHYDALQGAQVDA